MSSISVHQFASCGERNPSSLACKKENSIIEEQLDIQDKVTQAHPTKPTLKNRNMNL